MSLPILVCLSVVAVIAVLVIVNRRSARRREEGR
jgi:hypothetical protein